MGKKLDIAGQRFGRLTAVKPTSLNNRRQILWLFSCDCGQTIECETYRVIKKNTRSCGCLANEYRQSKIAPPGQAGLSSLYSEYKNAAKDRGHVFAISLDEFKVITSQNCFYCGIEPQQKQYKYKTLNTKENSCYTHNGIDRKNSSEGYTADNCLPCCKRCNIAKHAMSYDEFMAWLKRISEHKRWEKCDL